MVFDFGEATMERGVMGRAWMGSDRPGTTTVSPDSSPEEGRRIAPPPRQAGGRERISSKERAVRFGSRGEEQKGRSDGDSDLSGTRVRVRERA
jgi:hypothetical protein